MGEWSPGQFMDTGRLPLFCFFAGMVAGFILTRISVRMIRANVRWWPGNVSAGGLHVHHAVFGVVLMVFFGVVNLVLPDDLLGWRAFAAVGFGVGTALVLDEFALILHLEDVYWSEQGRSSIDALFAVIAVTGLLLLGVNPFLVEDLRLALEEQAGARYTALAITAMMVGLATVTVLKGKVWTGLVGLFVPLLLVVGSIRLARPGSPWARWRYRRGGRRGQRKLVRAQHREARWRTPVVRAKVWFQHLIAGTPD